jgi:glycosyltransferase involved in cell wall biosynthesis
MKTPLLYALHSGNLYGTERMALATLQGLRDDFDPVLFSPPGPVQEEAARLDFPSISFGDPLDFVRKVMPHFRKSARLAFIATGVVHSATCILLSTTFRNEVRHLHVVHGGTDERLSYGRKRWLKNNQVTFVAVSNFVREKLLAHGVPDKQIQVIENFLSLDTIRSTPRRSVFRDKIRKLVVVSRLDPIKKVDLLLDAIEREPVLSQLPVSIFGTGWDYERLSHRIARQHPSVRLAGFQDDIPRQISQSDLLVHLCSEEPFGLAILEAMAAHVPVLVPDKGGAGSLIQDGHSGFHFTSNCSQALAERLSDIVSMAPRTINQIVQQAAHSLDARFSPVCRAMDYRNLLLEPTHV